MPGFFIFGAMLLRQLCQQIPGGPYFYCRRSAVCPVMRTDMPMTVRPMRRRFVARARF
jgi:hypothetical protein